MVFSIEYQNKHGDCTPYTGEISFCAICEKAEVYLDDIHSEHQYIEDLGNVCLTCYLSGVESQSLNEGDVA